MRLPQLQFYSQLAVVSNSTVLIERRVISADEAGRWALCGVRLGGGGQPRVAKTFAPLRNCMAEAMKRLANSCDTTANSSKKGKT